MEISTKFLNRYNKQTPRYTSYPPATSFNTDFFATDFIKQIELSNNQHPENISIYIHIPFCPHRCHFCGCNTSVYESEEKVIRYIQCLKKEIRTITEYLDKKRIVTQVCWGGGTPNSINLDYVSEVMDLIKSIFHFADFAEISIECNPAYLGFIDIDKLFEIGFNRISLGIQDFNKNVLQAINRKLPKNDIFETMNYLKYKGFKGINIDLIYGLPLQTLDTFKNCIYNAIELNPDRIVTFSFAYVPWFNPEQKKLEQYRFPHPEEKLNMLIFAITHLSENVYEVIGMDHFAKKEDELAIAKYNNNLHRNFQGYCTKRTTGQVYAFGASAISQLHSCYAQNHKSITKYMEAIETDLLPVERGYILSDRDILIRDTINEIMCNGFLDFKEIANKHNCSVNDFISVTGFNKSKIADFIEEGMVEILDTSLRVSKTGMLFVRNIATAFDPNFSPSVNKHSQTI